MFSDRLPALVFISTLLFTPLAVADCPDWNAEQAQQEISTLQEQIADSGSSLSPRWSIQDRR